MHNEKNNITPVQSVEEILQCLPLSKIISTHAAPDALKSFAANAIAGYFATHVINLLSECSNDRASTK